MVPFIYTCLYLASYVTHASFKAPFDWHLEPPPLNTFYCISCINGGAQGFIRAIIKDCITKLGPPGPKQLRCFPKGNDGRKKRQQTHRQKETTEAQLGEGIKYSTVPLTSSQYVFIFSAMSIQEPRSHIKRHLQHAPLIQIIVIKLID